MLLGDTKEWNSGSHNNIDDSETLCEWEVTKDKKLEKNVYIQKHVYMLINDFSEK